MQSMFEIVLVFSNFVINGFQNAPDLDFTQFDFAEIYERKKHKYYQLMCAELYLNLINSKQRFLLNQLKKNIKAYRFSFSFYLLKESAKDDFSHIIDIYLRFFVEEIGCDVHQI